MSVPIVPILSLASGAVNLLNTVMSKSAPEGFDSLLTNLIGETDGTGAALLKGLMAKLKTEDADSTDALAATGAGMVAFQLMAALKDAGLNATDINALLTGEGVTLSDDSLKKLLTTFGLNDDQISTILSDKDLVQELKTQVTQGIKAMIGMKTTGNGGNEAQSPQTTTTSLATESQSSSPDGATPAAMDAQAKPAVERQGNPTGDHQADQTVIDQSKLAAAVQDLIKAATRNDSTLTAALKEIASLVPSTATGEGQISLKDLIQTALKRTETKAAMTTTDGSAATTIRNAVSTLEGTLGIQKDILEKLFLGTETDDRQAALSEIANRIKTYLTRQGDKPLDKEVKEALSLVRSATTKKEWSGIESVIKSVRPRLQVPETAFALDQGAFKNLVQHVSGGEASPVFERFTQTTIDQIKIQLPGQLKDGEGIATLKLNPPLLGRVEVSLVMENGQLQAAFKAENQCTKDMLQVHMATLKDALADQGIKVTQVTVTNSLADRDNRDQEAYAQWQQGWRHGDAHGGDAGHSGRRYREEGGSDYGATRQGSRYSSNGFLDLFA